jgi:hypothetical protein
MNEIDEAAVSEVADVFREQALRPDRTGGPNPSAVFIDEAARRAVQTLRWIGWQPPSSVPSPSSEGSSDE